MLTPYCKSKHDILGKDDLNALIRKNADIEARHPKLWATSEAVISRVLHNDVFVQSELTREAALRRLSLYVYTDKFHTALDKLSKARVCIISGVPGVGKTTLAEMLIIEYLMMDWQLVTIHQNVSEGLRAFRAAPKARQLFYYDDFLGQISSGEKLAKNEDGALIQLLHEAERNKKKRFILTTREYILAQAKQEHEKLARENIDVFRFVIECDDYDVEAKARILANHLYFNRVPQRHIAAIVKDRGYMKIISHENYNPRLIESMTSLPEVKACRPSQYQAAFVSRLDDPSQLWEHIYEEQLSEPSRQLLLVMATCGSPIYVSELERPFDSFFGFRCRKFGWQRRPSDFRRSLNELEGNFIRLKQCEDDQVVEFHNPSVLDFLKKLIESGRHAVEDLLATATVFDQIERLNGTFAVFRQLDQSKTSPPIEETILADAIERTFREPAIQLHHAKDRWYHYSCNEWMRLGLLIQLAERFEKGALRNVCSSLIETAFNSLEEKFVDSDDLTNVVSAIGSQKWLPAGSVKSYQKQVLQYLTGGEHWDTEDMDGLAITASWCADYRDRLSEEEFVDFVDRISAAVTKKVEDRFGEHEVGIWDNLLEGVETIQGVLDIDLKQEIEWIEEEKSKSFDPYEPDDDYRSSTRTSPSSPISAIFDSLLK